MRFSEDTRKDTSAHADEWPSHGGVNGTLNQ